MRNLQIMKEKRRVVYAFVRFFCKALEKEKRGAIVMSIHKLIRCFMFFNIFKKSLT